MEVVTRRPFDCMQHLGEVGWSLIDSAREDERAKQKIDSLFHRNPVKSVSYIGRDRVILETLTDNDLIRATYTLAWRASNVDRRREVNVLDPRAGRGREFSLLKEVTIGCECRINGNGRTSLKQNNLSYTIWLYRSFWMSDKGNRMVWDDVGEVCRDGSDVLQEPRIRKKQH